MLEIISLEEHSRVGPQQEIKARSYKGHPSLSSEETYSMVLAPFEKILGTKLRTQEITMSTSQLPNKH